MNSSKVKRASFSLEEEYTDLFRRIAKKTRRSMTDELRMMIDARAIEVGLKPINEDEEEDAALGRHAGKIYAAVRSGEEKPVPLAEVEAELVAAGVLDAR